MSRKSETAILREELARLAVENRELREWCPGWRPRPAGGLRPSRRKMTG